MAWLMPASASAGPITDFDVLVGEGYVLRFGERLSADDRSDGKQKLRGASFVPTFTFDVPSFPSGPSFTILSFGPSFQVPSGPAFLPAGGPLILPPGLLGPGTTGIVLVGPLGSMPPFQPISFTGTNSSSPAPVVTPEPASLILMGTGLLVVARRVRQRVAGAAARPKSEDAR